MLTIRNIFILLLASKLTFGQLNPKFHFSPLVLREQSSPLKLKRKDNYNAKYDIGVGADLYLIFSKYYDTKKNGIRFGPSIGQYYFWNNSAKTIEYNFEYKENNLVSPICFNIGFGNNPVEKFKSKKGLIYSVDLTFGEAYIQNSIVNIKSNEIITNKKWGEIFKIKFHILTVNFTKLLPHIGIGLEYTYLDKRSFGAINY